MGRGLFIVTVSYNETRGCVLRIALGFLVPTRAVIVV